MLVLYPFFLVFLLLKPHQTCSYDYKVRLRAHSVGGRTYRFKSGAEWSCLELGEAGGRRRVGGGGT